MVEAGREQARTQLDSFWKLAARESTKSLLRRAPYSQLIGEYTLHSSPVHLFMDMMNRLLSPYQINPNGDHPLHLLLEEFVTFELVRASKDLKVFINKTDVLTGTLRIFREHKMTVDMVLASTCLPTLFHAV